MKQERIDLASINNFLTEKTGWTYLLKKQK
jgi:hypothetical protein